MAITKNDILIILPLTILILLGVIMVTSSSIHVADDISSNPFYFAQRQVIFISIGLIALSCFLIVPSQLLYKADWVFMLLSILLLIALFIPDVGTSVNGSIRWIRLGSINVQPSEICKFSLILYISGYSVRRMSEINSLRSFLKPLGLLFIIAILIKFSSKGPVLFLQDRIGIGGKEFRIIKFRTMHVNSEDNGPQLSSENDPRITKIGRFLRKTRIDEFPQFINVILGEMSLVGPRPERKFYMTQIAEIEPQFLHLTNVRPGITSWGQVKFGYAENIEEMLRRMKYDLLYMKNRSLALDIKILFYTALTIIKAKGK